MMSDAEIIIYFCKMKIIANLIINDHHRIIDRSELKIVLSSIEHKIPHDLSKFPSLPQK